jgi:hypothetical protein
LSDFDGRLRTDLAALGEVLDDLVDRFDSRVVA